MLTNEIKFLYLNLVYTHVFIYTSYHLTHIAQNRASKLNTNTLFIEMAKFNSVLSQNGVAMFRKWCARDYDLDSFGKNVVYLTFCDLTLFPNFTC